MECDRNAAFEAYDAQAEPHVIAESAALRKDCEAHAMPLNTFEISKRTRLPCLFGDMVV